MPVKATLCPCGSGKPYAKCCEPYHLHKQIASTAEALMRSRYAAYVLEKGDYLLATWHPRTRPSSLKLGDDKNSKWIGLKVLQARAGQADDTEGTVEFVARYKINGKAHKLHETSRFVKEAGQWYYVSGKFDSD